jgi:hypothetical protein
MSPFPVQELPKTLGNKVSSRYHLQEKARFQSAMIDCFFGFLVADLGSKGSCKEPAKWVREPRGVRVQH